jgi:AraC-like DNA-binding protein
LSEEADLLALELIAGNVPSLDEFACDQGIAQRTLRRRFSDLYGMSAAKFRARARTRRAWRDILTRKASLAAIAYDHGFADQAHMTRAVVALTGATPTIWRRTLAV